MRTIGRDGTQAPAVARCAALTVTFNPDLEVLKRQVAGIPLGWRLIFVDNASATVSIDDLEALVAEHPAASVLALGRNGGLAAGINEGLRQLQRWAPDVSHVLLLDQDSEPLQGACEGLQVTYQQLEGHGIRVGAVGPTLQDSETGVLHGFHVFRRLRWVRVDGNKLPWVECNCLNGSGTFMRLDVALSLGGMDERLFIDHVDTEWSFRLSSHGYRLFGVPTSRFLHRMGERTSRLWIGRWLVWPSRSPARHRYLFRNAMLLLASRHVPHAWKAWAVPKLLLTFVVFVVTGPDRLSHARSMLAGVMDAIRGRTGMHRGRGITQGQ